MLCKGESTNRAAIIPAHSDCIKDTYYYIVPRHKVKNWNKVFWRRWCLLTSCSFGSRLSVVNVCIISGLWLDCWRKQVMIFQHLHYISNFFYSLGYISKCVSVCLYLIKVCMCITITIHYCVLIIFYLVLGCFPFSVLLAYHLIYTKLISSCIYRILSISHTYFQSFLRTHQYHSVILLWEK